MVSMEAMGVAQVGAWLRDELHLPQYAAAAAQHEASHRPSTLAITYVII